MLSQHSASEPYPSLLHVTNSNELPQPPRTIVIAVCMCLGLIGVSGDRSFSSLALEPTMCEAVRQNFGLVLGWKELRALGILSTYSITRPCSAEGRGGPRCPSEHIAPFAQTPFVAKIAGETDTKIFLCSGHHLSIFES